MGKVKKNELIDTESILLQQTSTLIEYVSRDLDDIYECLPKEKVDAITRCFDCLDMLSEKIKNINEVLNDFRKLEVA